ncbi:Alpha/beta hydrolase family protein [Corynebacterium capitovis DSM 44611]|uniref:alpha/beta hydrolase n=1 Tax=Corynebacterium capitovis TaxID=131081 RepID=UPI00039EC196|nr:alpha/beta hydrolase [Corynebacterium capitovis]WKD57463.1 Alpha/beta hydrolase family protein [Corynebacterium capitovis DSM 44611]
MHSGSTPQRLTDLTWEADILGPGYESAHLEMANNEQATLVRSIPDAPTGKPALLWVHGMSDYFFQTHVADYFTSQGYPFYAIDLRRCGRSHRGEELWHYTTDLSEYFPELTIALNLLAEKHGTVVPVAHSTGGLIVPIWADELRRRDVRSHSNLAGLVLDSPWLDMPFPGWTVLLLRGLVALLGKRFPTIRLLKGGTGTYGRSISASEHGEWDFDPRMKPVKGHNVELGWLRAVFLGQEKIHSGEVDTGVPMLTLCSSHSYLSKPYSAAADTADTVLDVSQIRRWAPTLSSDDSTVEVINGARHDVFLSEKHARETALTTTLSWLEQVTADSSDEEA